MFWTKLKKIVLEYWEIFLSILLTLGAIIAFTPNYKRKNAKEKIRQIDKETKKELKEIRRQEKAINKDIKKNEENIQESEKRVENLDKEIQKTTGDILPADEAYKKLKDKL